MNRVAQTLRNGARSATSGENPVRTRRRWVDRSGRIDRGIGRRIDRGRGRFGAS